MKKGGWTMQKGVSAIAMAAVAVLASAAMSGGPAPPAAKIDPKAQEYLKGMSAYLAGLQTYSFHVEEFFDEVQEDGQKIQLSNQRQLSVKRPDKVFVESEGDTSNSKFYYNGKTVTIFDPARKTYAMEKVGGTIDKMLDELHDRFDVHQPMADFLFSDPYSVLTEHTRTGAYVGLHYIGKLKCHHLAFRQRLVDWQIWIDTGEKPLPRKLVITFKRQVNEPQFTAFFYRWQVNPTVADSTFEFQPPEGTHKIAFLMRHAHPAPLKLPPGK